MESDLDNNEYEHTDDNYNSDSEDEDYNEFVKSKTAVSEKLPGHSVVMWLFLVTFNSYF